MKTAAQLTLEEIADYQASARRRHKQEQYRLRLREEHAWELARRAASLLREQFGATRVMVFGSLVHRDSFTPWSDVDIAAWGIRPDYTLQAIGAVMDISPDIELNLVDVNTCSPDFGAAIEREGTDI